MPVAPRKDAPLPPPPSYPRNRPRAFPIRLQCSNQRIRFSRLSCRSQRNAAFPSAAVSKTHDASLIAEVGDFPRIAVTVRASSGVCESPTAGVVSGLPTWSCDEGHRCGDDSKSLPGRFRRHTVAPIKDASCVFDRPACGTSRPTVRSPTAPADGTRERPNALFVPTA